MRHLRQQTRQFRPFRRPIEFPDVRLAVVCAAVRLTLGSLQEQVKNELPVRLPRPLFVVQNRRPTRISVREERVLHCPLRQ